MRFLVVTQGNAPLPMDQAPLLVAGMQQWLAAHRASGKMKDAWVFAGTPGGGGILDVDSHEELDDIMSGFPFANWSETKVYALADIDHSMQTFASVLAQMGGSSG